jgi:hypothetical protein
MAKCKACGGKIPFLTLNSSSFCEACQEQAQSLAQKLADEAETNLASISVTCPKCGATKRSRLTGINRAVVELGFLRAFKLIQCAECSTAHLAPRAAPLLVAGLCLSVLFFLLGIWMTIDGLFITKDGSLKDRMVAFMIAGGMIGGGFWGMRACLFALRLRYQKPPATQR